MRFKRFCFVVKDYAYEADAIKDNMDEYDFDTQYIRTTLTIKEEDMCIRLKPIQFFDEYIIKRSVVLIIQE